MPKHLKLTDDIKKKFSLLANELSPENICGDGEYTAAQANDRKERIMIQWWKLEDLIGMKVTPDIIEQWETDGAN
jgi:hypothetical protein